MFPYLMKFKSRTGLPGYGGIIYSTPPEYTLALKQRQSPPGSLNARVATACARPPAAGKRFPDPTVITATARKETPC